MTEQDGIVTLPKRGFGVKPPPKFPRAQSMAGRECTALSTTSILSNFHFIPPSFALPSFYPTFILFHHRLFNHHFIQL